VILAHNHVSGLALPSKEDEVTTRQIASALSLVGVSLVDHIIVADGEFVSMADSRMFNSI
jgi:DNA repair protein RadC